MSTTETLATALVAAQSAMPKVEPDATNPHFRTKFVSLDHLIAKTRPVLNKHGLAITQFPAVSELGQPVLRTTITHASGESVTADTPLLLGGKSDMQALGGAITYARRYAWAAALGIAGDEDDDGESSRRGDESGGKPEPDAKPQPASAGAAPVTGGGGTAAPTDTAQLLKLANEYGGPDLVKSTNLLLAKQRAAGTSEADFAGWVGRQVKRLEENLVLKRADAESAFQAPPQKDAA